MDTDQNPDTAKPQNQIAKRVVDTAFLIHQKLGPGLLESAYESVLVFELTRSGLSVRTQVPIPLIWEGLKLRESFRADVIVEDLVLLELKSVENLAVVHKKQALTYLRLTKLKLALVVNFGAASFGDCIHRVVNGL